MPVQTEDILKYKWVIWFVSVSERGTNLVETSSMWFRLFTLPLYPSDDTSNNQIWVTRRGRVDDNQIRVDWAHCVNVTLIICLMILHNPRKNTHRQLLPCCSIRHWRCVKKVVTVKERPRPDDGNKAQTKAKNTSVQSYCSLWNGNFAVKTSFLERHLLGSDCGILPSHCQSAWSEKVLYICSDVTSMPAALALCSRPVGLYPAERPIGLKPVVARPKCCRPEVLLVIAGRRRKRPDVTRSP